MDKLLHYKHIAKRYCILYPILIPITIAIHTSSAIYIPILNVIIMPITIPITIPTVQQQYWNHVNQHYSMECSEHQK